MGVGKLHLLVLFAVKSEEPTKSTNKLIGCGWTLLCFCGALSTTELLENLAFLDEFGRSYPTCLVTPTGEVNNRKQKTNSLNLPKTRKHLQLFCTSLLAFFQALSCVLTCSF